MEKWYAAIAATAVVIGLIVLAIHLLKSRRSENRDEIDGPIKRATPDLQPQYAGSNGSTPNADDDVPDMTPPDTTDGAGNDDSDDEEETEPEDDEPERSAAELIADGDSEAANAEWSEAVESYDAALEKLRAEKGNISLDLVPVLVKRIDAQTVVDSSDWDEETRPTELQLALSISELHHGVLSELNRPLILALIAFYDRFGIGDKADSLIRRLEQLTPSAKFAPASGHILSGQPWDDDMTKGDEALLRFEYDTAIEHFDAAWDAAEPKSGSYARLLAPMVLQCGLAYQARDNQTDEDDTIPSDYLTALGILERNVGPHDPALETVLTYLVSFYDQVGDHFRADRYVSRLQNALRSRS